MGRDGRERTRFTYHGGNLGAARLAYPLAPEPWVDLSTGINAVAYPVPPLDPAGWSALPDATAIADLEAAAARAYGTRAGSVIAAPGTQALIGWLPRLRSARHVGVLGFTYAEHARTWRDAGAAVDVVESVDALAGRDVAVVVNPNNPDGRWLPPEELARLATHVGLLVVDEAFMDVLPPGASLAPTRPANAVVLRSFGKAYGLAGLRLGFALADGAVGAALRRALGPWAVSGAAVAIGGTALADPVWLASAIGRLTGDAVRLDGLLASRGARILGGTPLFRLAEVDDAGEWFDRLARAGLLVRPFAERPRWLRFGLPAAATQWERLAAALPKR